MKDIIKVTLFAVTLISYISAFVLFMQSTRMPVSDNTPGIVTALVGIGGFALIALAYIIEKEN